MSFNTMRLAAGEELAKPTCEPQLELIIETDFDDGLLPPNEKFTVPETEPEMRTLESASLKVSEEKAEFKDIL